MPCQGTGQKGVDRCRVQRELEPVEGIELKALATKVVAWVVIAALSLIVFQSLGSLFV